MTKKVLAVILNLALVAGSAFGTTITRPNNYVNGTVIDATQVNANETTIYNDYNGNINSSNIAANGVAYSNLSANVQSIWAYKRPVLTYVDGTHVDVSVNSPTANTTCVQFPNDYRCVTENTSSTAQFRRAGTAATASLASPYAGGVRSGETIGNNTWWAAYMVKATDSASNMVLVLSQTLPTQGNVATLNGYWGASGWVYIGLVRYGNNADGATNIQGFVQTGNVTYFDNSCTVNSVGVAGTNLATTASAASLSYSYSGGTGAAQVPGNISLGYVSVLIIPGNTGDFKIASGASSSIWEFTESSNVMSKVIVPNIPIRIGQGVAVTAVGGSSISINLFGWVDDALGTGFNPQI